LRISQGVNPGTRVSPTLGQGKLLTSQTLKLQPSHRVFDDHSSMNAELLDPFAQDYPETLTASFNFGHATCLRFNHSGSHVAVGLVDGAVTIWDTATSGIARFLKAHTRTVQSLW
jgi:WD40 repeat protein